MVYALKQDYSSKRFIEELFPVKEVSFESSREKNIMHGHITTLHIWWARRPLAASRATIYASLIPYRGDEKDQRSQQIVDFSKWNNSLDLNIINKIRKNVFDANNGSPPKVLDPFGGGGSIPLEALRVGCSSYSNDYNPVAVLLQKCILEYPQKYGQKKSKGVNKDYQFSAYQEQDNTLLTDVRKWGKWVFDAAKKDIGKFYSTGDESMLLGFIWAKTIPCQNSRCGKDIPLFHQYWLSKTNEDRLISLFPVVRGNDIQFKLVGKGYEKMPKGFNPDKGNIARAIVTCLACGSAVDNKTTSRLFREGKNGERLIATVYQDNKNSGKKYRLVDKDDLMAFQKSSKYIEKKVSEFLGKYGFNPIPDEPTPEGKGRGAERAFSIKSYGMDTWGDLFNSRQLLSMVTFVEKIKEAYKNMLNHGIDEDYAKAITTYLALMLDKLADKNSNLVIYDAGRETIGHVFGRQVLGMVWDYVELNPFGNLGWPNIGTWVEKNISHLSQIPPVNGGETPVITQTSATSLPYENNFFDAIITDPPYYDNVPYSYLSDFFYVWLKRTIGDLHPDLFATPLTPKKQEIVAYSNNEGGFEGGKLFFEDMLKRSFIEINRVLKEDGISIIVYAHKSTAAWETLINSILQSGLVVTSAWPLNTERKSRLRASESAALTSSIYMVARKKRKKEMGFYREVRQELKEHLTKKLDQLWKEGFAGADFLISAIGSSIEVFGKYEKIIDDEGSAIQASKFLEIVRMIVTDYAVHKILHNGFAEDISRLSRFYLIWRWAYGEKTVPYDDARKLAQSLGIDLSLEWNKNASFIHKENEFIRVLGPEERKIVEKDNYLAGSREMIDVMHSVLTLWKQGKKQQIMDILKQSGFGNNDIFYRVAQAVSESLPDNSKEKKALEGFVAGKERISEEISRKSSQRRLFE